MPNISKRPESLAARAFAAIAERCSVRSKDIARFTASQYSFEEWVNWEAFGACAEVREWEVHPKPRYCNLGVTDCKDLGDLLINPSYALRPSAGNFPAVKP